MKTKTNQKNVKLYIKKNLISFLIGIIIFGGVGVYAAITFPSNDVTYDNTQSGLQSTTVKGAIDELYETCTALPPGEQIIEDAGLEKDPYECRYFFTGANPNNYITFNDEKAGWRIISVECDGRIKIMKTADINTSNNIAWDNSSSNNWARPASLNTYLNGTYYNGLNATAQNQIVAKDWSIGAVTYGNNDLANTINEENNKKWTGKVALVTMSEYLRSNSNKSSCGTFSLYSSNYSSCKDTTWIYYSSDYWCVLSPCSEYSSNVLGVAIGGFVDNYRADITDFSVRPALYLSSDIKITGGDGSQSNPYQIS